MCIISFLDSTSEHLCWPWPLLVGNRTGSEKYDSRWYGLVSSFLVFVFGLPILKCLRFFLNSKLYVIYSPIVSCISHACTSIDFTYKNTPAIRRGGDVAITWRVFLRDPGSLGAVFYLPRVTTLRKVSKIVLLLIGKTRGTIIKLVKATVSFSPKNIPHALFVVTAVCNNLYVGEAARTFSAIQQASVIFIDW